VRQSLIFPGVGAFETAVEHLSASGLLEPLRDYVRSGRPYLGICIGMQILFESSAESPTARGLGIIPARIESFDNADKAVPHMGWNSVHFLDAEAQPAEGLREGAHFYFVHSFRAPYAPARLPDAAQWTHTTAQYGQEVFSASVRRGSVFGCQFHPEKSGAAGLAVLDAWLRQPELTRADAPAAPRVERPPAPRDGLTKRIIACMDVRANDDGDLVVTKGDQYDVRERPADVQTSGPADAATTAPGPPGGALTARTGGAVRNLGKPVALAARYAAAGADELCLLNITSFRKSPLADQPMLALVRAAAARVHVPLTIGGGIKDTAEPDGTPVPALRVAAAYFRAGADKVSIGSEAVYAVERLHASGGVPDGTSAIETIAHAYGRQAVVVSIDPRRTFVDDPDTYSGPHTLVRGAPETADAGRAWWYQCTVSGGREARDLDVVALSRGVERLGAGEILCNCIDRDGTGAGFDANLLRLVRGAVRIPVVASSGAGSAQHFVDVFRETDVESALAAGIFHREEVKIQDVKDALVRAGIPAREEYNTV
jgi:glutamine amidotransferase/cyclase